MMLKNKKGAAFLLFPIATAAIILAIFLGVTSLGLGAGVIAFLLKNGLVLAIIFGMLLFVFIMMKMQRGY